MFLRMGQLSVLSRFALAALCALALAGSAGCRKSGQELKQEHSEEEELLLRAEWEFQQAAAQAQNLFDQGKEYEKNKRYKDAIEAWATAVQTDKRVELKVKLAKNLMAKRMIDEAYYLMHRPLVDRRFPGMAKERIDIVLDPASGFMKKHIEKASEAQRDYDHIKKGWEQYFLAKLWVEGGKIPEGRALLDSICKTYPKTLLADAAMVLLEQYKPKKEID